MSRTSVHTMHAQLLVCTIEIALVHFAGLYSLITWLSRYLCYFVVSATHNLRNFVTSVTPLLCSPLIFSFCFFCFCFPCYRWVTFVTLTVRLLPCYFCHLVTPNTLLLLYFVTSVSSVILPLLLPCYFCYLATLLLLIRCLPWCLVTCVTLLLLLPGYLSYLVTPVTLLTLSLCYLVTSVTLLLLLPC